MTNREYLAAYISRSEYTDSEIADVISDALMSITDEEDCSIAVICGSDKKLLTEWLGSAAERTD